jgi:hypothetical protein
MEVNERGRNTAVSLAVIGAASVAVALVLYAIFRRWLLWSTLPMALGAVLLGVAGVLAAGAIVGFFGTRRGRVGANVALTVFAAVALWGIVNVIGARQYVSIDLTAARKFSIGPQTIAVLEDLSSTGKTVRITTISPAGDVVFDRVRDLLDSYEARLPSLEILHIDPDFDVAEIRLFVDRFGDLPDFPGIAFECEDRKKSISEGELVDLARLPDGRPRPGAEPRFRGEAAITAAILSVTEETPLRVYFTRGHDEADFTGAERFDTGLWARELRLQNADVTALDLPTAERVPTDADVVIVARPDPEIPFEDRELHLLDRYLADGGKIMILLEPMSPPQIAEGVVDSLVRWLAAYGARLPNGEIVVDPPASYRHPVVFKTSSFADHEIVRDLAGTFMDFYFARPIEPVEDNSKRFTPTPLVYTSREGWTETDIDPEQIQKPSFDEDRDHRGPVCLALALEARDSPEGGGPPARIVVSGDADICTNEGLAAYANRAFAMNSINWLAQREPLISVPSRPFAERRLLTVGAEHRRAVFWITVIGLPAMSLLLGLAVWSRRRK